jgi:hypothetical protein
VLGSSRHEAPGHRSSHASCMAYVTYAQKEHTPVDMQLLAVLQQLHMYQHSNSCTQPSLMTAWYTQHDIGGGYNACVAYNVCAAAGLIHNDSLPSAAQCSTLPTHRAP